MIVDERVNYIRRNFDISCSCCEHAKYSVQHSKYICNKVYFDPQWAPGESAEAALVKAHDICDLFLRRVGNKLRT